MTSWWERIALWFLPKRYASDMNYTTVYKVWRGKFYVVGELKPMRPAETRLRPDFHPDDDPGACVRCNGTGRWPPVVLNSARPVELIHLFEHHANGWLCGRCRKVFTGPRPVDEVCPDVEPLRPVESEKP